VSCFPVFSATGILHVQSVVLTHNEAKNTKSHTQTQTHMHTQTHVHTRACTHTNTHAHKHKCKPTNTHAQAHRLMHTHIHAHTHTNTHVHTPARMHTQSTTVFGNAISQLGQTCKFERYQFTVRHETYYERCCKQINLWCHITLLRKYYWNMVTFQSKDWHLWLPLSNPVNCIRPTQKAAQPNVERKVIFLRPKRTKCQSNSTSLEMKRMANCRGVTIQEGCAW
jgi:hypothetical protein